MSWKELTAGYDDFKLEDFYCDEPVSGLAAEDLLAASRLALLVKFPFFGKLSLNMVFIENNNIPTTAVDARGNFYYNRKWMNHMTDVDAQRSVAHETMHLVQRFFARKPKGANHKLFNLAGDYVLEVQLNDCEMAPSRHSAIKINEAVIELVREYETVPAVYRQLLKEAEDATDCEACKQQIKQLQQQGQQNKQQNREENRKLNEESANGDEQGDGGGEGPEQEGSGPSCESGSGAGGCGEPDEGEGHGHGEGPPHTCGIMTCCTGSLSDTGELDPDEQQKWTEIVVGAKIHAEGKGNMPAGLGEYIDQLTESKVRWQDHLKSAATRLFGRDRYTYVRPNRRGPALSMRIPGHQPDGKSAVVSIDTSASMSTEEVRQCITEAREILKVCGCQKMWLILHDTRVFFSDYIEEADLTKMKMARGGTSHGEVFACLEKRHPNEKLNVPKEEDVTLAVMFTDLGTDFPDKKPEFEVIWGVPSCGCPGMSCPVPFGTKVEVELNE